ncbi:MAG: hypothetical protein P1P81_11100 [Desulfobulbales bacterium]|nr:hypothetical protein [Desulfobulbales bacterium]
MYDPELKYCPSCNDEYRPEIGKCPVCEVDLITGREILAGHESRLEKMAQRRGKLTPDDELVTIRRGPLAEMKAYEGLLNAERISSLLAGDESSCGKGCCASFDLVVRREEAQDALRIIEAEIRRTSIIDVVDGAPPVEAVFDPLSAENTCPACGHGFSGGTECPDCGLCF